MKQNLTHKEQPPPKQEIVAAIPCFNEERFIGSVVVKVKKYIDKVIVIDDGSTDATAEVAEAAGALVVRHQRNQGKGVAIRSAFEWAKEAGCKALVLLDGDGQHEPANIPDVLRPVLDGEADMVVGSRFLADKGQVPRHRKIGQGVLTSIINLGSRVKLSDSQSGFRAFSAKAIEVMAFREEGLSVESEMQLSASSSGLRVIEVPIDVYYLDKAKRSPVEHGINVLSRIMVLFSLRHPLLLFGLPGLILLGVGLGIGAHVLTIFSATKELAVGYGLGTILLSLAGLLSLFVALMLQAMKELLRGEASRLTNEARQPSSDKASNESL